LLEKISKIMKIKNVADLYPLSPMQQGMLFHTLYEPDSGAYVMHVIGTLPAHLDVPAFKRAWERLLTRHSVLRTSFVWQGLNEPLQVVREKVELRWEELDWRNLSPSAQEEQMKDFLATDRRNGFDLSKAPLMRLTLVRIDDSTSRFIWSYHHIVIDGWSLPLLFKELLAYYEAFSRGAEIELPQGRPFREYIAWLGRQDMSHAEIFWRELLTGFDKATTLRPAVNGERNGGEERTQLARAATAALQATARNHQVTLNTLVHGALALVLSQQSGSRDVVFGVTVSGRPVSLDGVESMVGIFINLLPNRVRIVPEESLGSWLRKLQQQQFAMRQFEYYPLVQAQRWTNVPRGQSLFDTILTFENFPVEDTLQEQTKGLEIGNVHDVTANNYPLTVIATPNPDLVLRFIYGANTLDLATVKQVQQQVVTMLDEFVKSPEAHVKLFMEKLSEGDKQQQVLAQQEREKSNLKRFKQIKPKAVSLSQDEMIKTSLLDANDPLVLVVSPGVPDLDISQWARDNREFINQKLSRHGAILFRDCQVDTVGKFEHFAQAVCSELFGEYGDLPREGVGGNIYGSTPYPADQTILFHNESSHTHRWPMKIWFHCVTAAQHGGETPIVDCRKVYQLLDPELRQLFADKKLRYVRNYTDGLDVSWQEFFRTSDKSQVEAFCSNAGIEFEWKDNGLRTYKVCQAVATHPQTGELVFFNQLQLHHISCLEASVRESVTALFDEADLPRNVYYGDGTPISDGVVAEVLRVYRKAACSFPWREGDVLLLDNMLTAHGRNPYQGARKIVVALGEIVNNHLEAKTATR
jgi:alpha-ketoglutarate-dependent taurine dioxygenase